ncbi:GNAT family N-acetyltransferase [Pedobacter frigidisoli]|uniref:GNAT family N-acetyltransferase n=1 Tax=Pedobacter frigidisoli TaxID=2530455 RepID=A0A4R0PCU6_9SPHI|nr:GNAT family N-acetyltransferase [Pedobacter frigidisoli]TCD12973.1 GNAT family N-acetyltransferase [Pedobacter frigidisoli]
MIKKKYFSTSQEFLNVNAKIIDKNYFAFYSSLMNMLASKQLFQLWDIYDRGQETAYCMWFDENIVVHSFGWTDETLEAIERDLDFPTLTGYTLSGQRIVITDLLEFNDVPYEVIKDRIVYSIDNVSPQEFPDQQIQKAFVEDKLEIAEMSHQYYMEEYQGKGPRTAEYFYDITKSGIENGNIYKLTIDGNICSIAQVISEEKFYPLIGQFFTKSKLRGKGYGYSLLTQLSSLLLSKGHLKVGLLADRANPRSIKIFERVGYLPVYDHLAVLIK